MKRPVIVMAIASLLFSLVSIESQSANAGTSLVYTAMMPKPHLATAPNGGTDDYRCFLIDPGIKEDSLITSVKFLPQRRVLWHHAIFDTL